MKKRFWILWVALLLVVGMTVQAEEYYVSEKEAEDRKIYTLTYQETKDGKIEEGDISRTFAYGGIEYNLVSADIEYTYETLDTKKAVSTHTEELQLAADMITHIPKYKESGDQVFVLDDENVELSVSGKEEKEGAEIVTTNKTITELPDNDLIRIPMTEVYEGITCELLYVVYEITDYDENGVPSEYKAYCRYGGLDKYTEDIDAEWVASVTYTGYQLDDYVKSSTISYVYQYIEYFDVVEEIEETKAEVIPDEPEIIVDTEIPVEEKKQINAAVVAAASVGGILFAVVGGVLLLTVPVYAALGTGDYKYIGRMRLKKKDDLYEGILKESVADKAEIGNFMIRVPKRVQKRNEVEMLNIVCPDGKVIRKKMQDEVLFKIN